MATILVKSPGSLFFNIDIDPSKLDPLFQHCFKGKTTGAGAGRGGAWKIEQ